MKYPEPSTTVDCQNILHAIVIASEDLKIGLPTHGIEQFAGWFPEYPYFTCDLVRHLDGTGYLIVCYNFREIIGNACFDRKNWQKVEIGGLLRDVQPDLLAKSIKEAVLDIQRPDYVNLCFPPVVKKESESI